MDSPHLIVPHPRWRVRAFVVCPLRDVAPERVSDDLVQAVAGQRIQQWE
jgi:2-amino-4-hydroxy-6-hydroxymethyldihydropteridine diphosphokinase